MSHDASGRDSCSKMTWILLLQFDNSYQARGVTDRGVGSGALLGWWALEKLGPKNLLHRLTLRQFVDQLVQVSNLTHRRLLDFFDANPADYAFD